MPQAENRPPHRLAQRFRSERAKETSQSEKYRGGGPQKGRCSTNPSQFAALFLPASTAFLQRRFYMTVSNHLYGKRVYQDFAVFSSIIRGITTSGVRPDRAQGAHEHEAKEHDLPLVRQRRA